MLAPRFNSLKSAERLQNNGPTLLTYIHYRSAGILYNAETLMQDFDWLYYDSLGDYKYEYYIFCFEDIFYEVIRGLK